MSGSAALLMVVRAEDEEEALANGSDEEQTSVGAFTPDFTYPIFGEQEKIFGYKGLEIKVGIVC